MNTKFIKLLFLCLILIIVSCKKETEPVMLNLTSANWYTTKVNNGGTVNVKVAGISNADKITIMMYGDGVPSEVPLEINGDKNFTGDVVVSFSYSARQVGVFEKSTVLKAYKGSDVKELQINSGPIQY